MARDVVDPPSDSAAPSLPDIEQSAAEAAAVTEIVDAIETACSSRHVRAMSQTPTST